LIFNIRGHHNYRGIFLLKNGVRGLKVVGRKREGVGAVRVAYMVQKKRKKGNGAGTELSTREEKIEIDPRDHFTSYSVAPRYAKRKGKGEQKQKEANGLETPKTQKKIRLQKKVLEE